MCILLIENEFALSYDVGGRISSDKVKVYKRATFMYDSCVMQEIFRAAIDIWDIALISTRFDKSACDVKHLKSKHSALTFAEDNLPILDGCEEYMYWLQHNTQLTQQMISIISTIQLIDGQHAKLSQLATGSHENKVKQLSEYLQQKYNDLLSDVPLPLARRHVQRKDTVFGYIDDLETSNIVYSIVSV